MNLMTDSEQKWALEAESKPEIEGKHLHQKICSNKWFKPLTPIEPNTLIPWVQNVYFY